MDEQPSGAMSSCAVYRLQLNVACGQAGVDLTVCIDSSNLPAGCLTLSVCNMQGRAQDAGG